MLKERKLITFALSTIMLVSTGGSIIYSVDGNKKSVNTER